MNKKIVLILIIILIVLGAFLTGYLINRRSFPAQIQTGSPNNLERFSGRTFPPENQKLVAERLLKISTVTALSPTLSKNGNSIVFYEKTSGKVFEADFSGSTKSISEKTLPGLLSTIWSANKKEVISRFVNKVAYFNYETNKNISLNKNIRAVAFSPDGSKIAYLYFDPATQSGSISISKPDGTLFKNILNTRLENADIYWPAEDVIAFNRRVVDKEPVSLLTLDTDGEKLNKIVSEKVGLEAIFDNEGRSLVYSFFNENGGLKLFHKNLISGDEVELPNPTFAKKCVWSVDNINLLCAVPSGLPSQFILSDNFFSQDSIYRTNTLTKESELLVDLSGNEVDARDLILSPLEDNLIFVNKQNGFLYRLSLQ